MVYSEVQRVYEFWVKCASYWNFSGFAYHSDSPPVSKQSAAPTVNGHSWLWCC